MSNPNHSGLVLAEQHFRAGRHQLAEQLLGQILLVDPALTRTYELLAYIAGNQGRLDACEVLLSQAFALPGCSAEACFYLGRVRLQLGRVAQALEPLQVSLQRGGEFVEGLHELGVAHSGLGAHRLALDAFQRASRLQPRSAEVHASLASTLACLRRYPEALRHSETALTLNPRLVHAWIDLGITLTELFRFDEALKSYDRALALAPKDAAVNRGRALVLARAGRHAEALAAWRILYEVAPDADYLAGNLLQAAMRVCDWSEWHAMAQAAVEGVHAGRRSAMPFALMAVPASPACLLASAQIFVRTHWPVAAGRLPAGATDGRRLRIAYVSADFGDHPTSQLIAGLFERHDRSRFETFGYALSTRPESAMRQRIVAGLEHFIDVSTQSDADVAELLKAAGIDIAVDLMGFTEGCRPGIFALRAAPLQVSWLGFPGSMGADFIDYIVADATVIGVDDRAHYAEKVVTLPGSYQVNDDRKAIASLTSTREAAGLPPQGFVYACFNGLQKITPDVFAHWVSILQQVPGSVLWLLRGAGSTALDAEAAASGLEPGRIVWAEPLPLAEHLARHALADLFLDTFHYNAHTTCSDALWAGLPVLTLAGATFASRVGSSLLKAVGLPQLVTATADAYEAQAVALALSPESLRDLRDRLQCSRSDAPLFNTALFTRRLETAYEAMSARLAQRLEADHIEVAG